MMYLASSSETSVSLYQISRRHIKMTAVFIYELVINLVFLRHVILVTTFPYV